MPTKVFFVGTEHIENPRKWTDSLGDNLKTLTKEDFQFFDEIDILPGSIFIDELIDFIQKCDKIVLLLTPGFLDDSVCSYAANLALSLENDTDRPRLGSVITVVLQDTTVPYKYKHKKNTLRFDDPNFVIQLWEQLIKELEWGPGPFVYGVQICPSTNLLERTSDVVSIAERFIGRRAADGGNMLGIWGAPGIGKTSLAALTCRYVFKKMFIHIYWVHCGKEPNVVKILSGIRRQLCGSDGQKDFADLIAARNWLMQFTRHEKIFFVLDDVWNPEDASVFTVISKDCWLLITTRDRAVLGALHVEEILLDFLNEDNSWHLFIKRANVSEQFLVDHNIVQEAISINSHLGGYPLAVSMIASSLRQCTGSGSRPFSRQRWKDMEASLREKDKRWMKSKRLPVDSYPGTFLGAFEATFDCLQDTVDSSQPLNVLQETLLHLSLFKKDVLIQSSTLAILSSYIQGDTDSAKRTTARRVRDSLFTLADKSLLKLCHEDDTSGNSFFRIHDLVLQYIQHKAQNLWGSDGVRRMHVALLASHVVAAEGLVVRPPTLEMIALQKTDVCGGKERSDSGFQDDFECTKGRANSCNEFQLSAGTKSGHQGRRDISNCCNTDLHIVLNYSWWKLDLPHDTYLHSNIIHHCLAADGELPVFYKDLLCTLRWLQSKLNKTSLSEVLCDFELLECSGLSTPLHDAVYSAIVLHASIIVRNKYLLGPVMLGSLSSLEVTGISIFLKNVEAQLLEDVHTYIVPRHSCISPPYGNLLKTYSAHNGASVLALRVLKDGTVVTTSADGFIRLINQSTGEETRLGSDETKHSDLVTCFDVDHSETFAVTGACDSVVKIWDLKTKQLRKTINDIHDRQIYSLVLSADERSVLTVSGDKTIKLWHLQDGIVNHTYKGHTDVVACVVRTNLTDRDIFFASCSYDNMVCLWRKNNPDSPVATSNPRLGELYTLSFSPSSEHQHRLYVGGKRGIGVLEFPSLKVKQVLPGHEGGAFALHVARDNTLFLLLSGGDDGRIKIWDIKESGTHSLLFQHQIHSAAVRAIFCALNKDKLFVYTASTDQSAKLSCFLLTALKESVGQPIAPSHVGPVSALSACSGQYVISASWDRQLILWDMMKAEAIGVIGKHVDGDKITALASHEDHCFSGSDTGALCAWGLLDRNLSPVFSHVLPAGIAEVIHAGDSYLLLVGLLSDLIYVWNTKDPTKANISHVIETSHFWLRCLQMTSKTSVVAAFDDATARLCFKDDSLKQPYILTSKIKDTPPFPVVPVPKFKEMIIGFDEDNRLRTLILETERNSKINSGLPNADIATAIAISDDQDYLVCGSDNGNLSIVTRHGKIKSTLRGAGGKIKCIELLPNVSSILVLTVGGVLVEYAQGKEQEAFPSCEKWMYIRWNVGDLHIDRVKVVSDNYVALLVHKSKRNIHSIQLWDMSSKSLSAKLVEGHGTTSSILVLKNGLFFTGSGDGHVRAWDLNGIVHVQTLRIKLCVKTCHAPYAVNYLCCTPDEMLYLTASFDNKIGVHKTGDGDLVRVISTQQHYGMRCLSVTSDGKYIMCCHQDIFAQMIDLATGKAKRQMLTYNTAWSRPRLFSGSRVFAEGPRCTINVSNSENGDSITLLGTKVHGDRSRYAHTRAVTAIVQYDDNHIISGSYDKSIILWLAPKHNLAESRSLCQFYFEHIVTTLLVIGQKLCVGLKNGSVIFLDIHTNEMSVSQACAKNEML